MIKNIMKNIGTKKHYPTVGEYAADGPIEQREAMQKLLKEDKAENPDVKKLAEQNEKFLNRRDELIAKGKLTEKEAEEMKNLTNIIQMNTSAMLNLTGDNKEKKPLTSPDLIPSYDDFNPYRD